MDKTQIMQDPRLIINSVDDNGHLFMVSSLEKPEQNFIFSHIEYGRKGLKKEYESMKERLLHIQSDIIRSQKIIHYQIHCFNGKILRKHFSITG